MRKVIVSIQPKWCELIAEGDKTIEVRKTAPRIKTPFKCFIYCTNKKLAKDSYLYINSKEAPKEFGATCRFNKAVDMVVNEYSYLKDFHSYRAFGRVIGEFICNRIDTYDLQLKHWEYSDNVRDAETLESVEILKPSYKITQEELDKMCIPWYEFSNYGVGKILYGWHISDLKLYDMPKEFSDFGLKTPPQSWGYVDAENM